MARKYGDKRLSLAADLAQYPDDRPPARAQRLGWSVKSVHNTLWNIRHGSGAAGETDVRHCQTGVFTPAEVEALKALLEERKQRQAGTRWEKGKLESLTVRVDSGLVAVLRAAAAGRGVALSAVVREALEVYAGFSHRRTRWAYSGPDPTCPSQSTFALS